VQAGAELVFVGIAKPWRPFPGREALAAMERVAVVPLDVTDSRSVEDLAVQIGGKVDILVNTAEYVRPGGSSHGREMQRIRESMEVNYFGLARLAQSFGPAMRSRAADRVNNACAWVNILSVYALANLAPFGTFSESKAAAYSLSHALRSEMQANGIRVINIFPGPVDDEWHQTVPVPKVAPSAIASAIINALKDGVEDVYVGDIARDIFARWRDNPKALEREGAL
jgi:short-subunit dehydrogenase